MLNYEKNLCGTWKMYYGENHAVKKIASSIKTEADAARLLFSSVDAQVPGNFELDLHKAGLIPDPYVGENTLAMQKLENLHLWYCTTFTFEGDADENTFLRFEGIDTVGEIYLNGELIKSVANMFLTYDIPVPELKKGENELVVHIIPAVIASREHDVPVSANALAYNYESLYMRKAASMYGWDIMPRIVSGGIWKPVSLIQKKPDRIEDVFLYTNRRDANGASLMAYFTLHVEKDFLHDFIIRVSGACGDSTFSMECEPLHTNGRLSCWIPDAKLWWPKNAGEQNLYDCVIELLYAGEVVDTMKMRTGIRTVELSRTSTTDAEGNGDFCFVINGKRVFAMGTNWVPLDAFHSNDINRVDRTMEMVKDIHCNIIRLWGGNVYESQRLFDLCDEYGVMVWQDFGMGCGAYPQDEKFRQMLEPEVIQVIKDNRNHPSLVLWAGDNECDAAITWAGSVRDPNKNVVTRVWLAEWLRIHDFTRPYLPSSPYIDEYAYKTGKPTSEEHLWGPRDYFKGEYYKNTVCHFASETGYHGCPSPASIEKFITEGHRWPIFDENNKTDREWMIHAACMRGNKEEEPYGYRIHLMDDQVQTLFGTRPDNLHDFAMMSQISQAEAKKYFIERFRITRGRRNGIIWWNLIDGWPQISDAVVDYYYTKKLAYHYIKASQNPVCLAFDEPECEGTRLTLYGINDTTKAVDVTYRVRNITDGTVVATASGHLPAEKSSSLITIDIQPGEKKFYYIEWEANNGESVERGANHFFTNILEIDYKAYVEALDICGMRNVEGF